VAHKRAFPSTTIAGFAGSAEKKEEKKKKKRKKKKRSTSQPKHLIVSFMVFSVTRVTSARTAKGAAESVFKLPSWSTDNAL
jgi:hypothetical protein